jgi:hypothetical protein
MLDVFYAISEVETTLIIQTVRQLNTQRDLKHAPSGEHGKERRHQ